MIYIARTLITFRQWYGGSGGGTCCRRDGAAVASRQAAPRTVPYRRVPRGSVARRREGVKGTPPPPPCWARGVAGPLRAPSSVSYCPPYHERVYIVCVFVPYARPSVRPPPQQTSDICCRSVHDPNRIHIVVVFASVRLSAACTHADRTASSLPAHVAWVAATSSARV